MNTTPSSTPGVKGADKDLSNDPDQIETEIAQHRHELSKTVDELTERLDVKKQAQRKIDSVKAQATTRLHGIKAQVRSDGPDQVGSVLAPALGVVAGVALLAGIVRRVRR